MRTTEYFRIREARKVSKMTQEELARVLGINRATLSKYESGAIDPPSSQLQAIASALGVSINQLLPEPTEEERATVADIIREIGMPHGPNGKATVAETKKVLRRVAELYGDNAVVLIRLTSIMDEAGEVEVVEYAKSILQEHIDRGVFPAEPSQQVGKPRQKAGNPIFDESEGKDTTLPEPPPESP